MLRGEPRPQSDTNRWSSEIQLPRSQSEENHNQHRVVRIETVFLEVQVKIPFESSPPLRPRFIQQ